MPDMRVVGVFPRRFDADLAVARLDSAGIEAVIIADTNPETGNVGLGGRGYRVAVREEIAEDAATVLNGENPAAQAEIDELDMLFHQRRFADRSALVRWGTIAVLAAMAGPVVIALLFQMEWLVDAVFP